MTRMSMGAIRPEAYNEFWFDRSKRYMIIKGSRGSAKSYTVALWIIFHMMKHKGANTLVIRRYANTNKDSTFATLLWAIERLGASSDWTATKSPLELIYNPHGTKILFRGLDEGNKVTSITVANGSLCWGLV